jgi:hypothetical protein
LLNIAKNLEKKIIYKKYKNVEMDSKSSFFWLKQDNQHVLVSKQQDIVF